MFAKITLVTDLIALVQSAGPLLNSAGSLLPEVEAVGLEAVGLVRHLNLAAAEQFVSNVKGLWADAMAAYDGSGAAVAGFVAAVKQLIADLKG